MSTADSLEWSLLRLSVGGFDVKASIAGGGSGTAHQQLQLIADGRFADALSLPSLRKLIGYEESASDVAARSSSSAAYFESLEQRVQSSLQSENLENGTEQLLFCAGVAIYIFLQANLTGPPLEIPECPAELHRTSGGPFSGTSEALSQEHGLGEEHISAGDRFAIGKLLADGEEVEGRVRLPQYLLLARFILLTPLGLQNLGHESAVNGEALFTDEGPSPSEGEPPSLKGEFPPMQEGTYAANEGMLTAEGASASTEVGTTSMEERESAEEAGTPFREGGAPSTERGKAPIGGSLHKAAAKTGMQTWLWWTARLLTLQQRLLRGPAASLRRALQDIFPLVLQEAQSYAEATSSSEGGRDFALAELEAALMEHIYRHPGAAEKHIKLAGEALGLTAELTGAMGLRTEHQVDAKAQLVLQTSRRDVGSNDSGDDAAELDAFACREARLKLGDDAQPSDVLDAPRILQDDAGTAESQQLSPLEQAYLLARSQQLKLTARDELLGWQMGAFADAVLAQKNTRFVVHAAARLMRVRHERGRTRTRERALLGMEQLAEAAQAAEPPASRRLRLAFAVLLPLRGALRRELGEQLVAAGMVGAAMEVFEQEELWDSLLICYRLLKKTPQALTLVQKRLEVTPDDARLLCALGDITLDVTHYEEAWERSCRRSARAQRSLARMAMGRSQFQQAGEHWELALALNPLHAEGWFALGYCCLKQQRYARAVQAFTRAAQQQPDNGEAWNNLAAIHMQDGRFKEAFSALREAIKYKRDSWQTWSNYAAAAVQTGHFQQAAHAVEQVGRMTQWQRQEVEVLQALVQAVHESREKAGTVGIPQPGGGRSEGATLERSVQAALSSASAAPSVPPAVWGQVALLNEALGFPDSVREALKKQLRGLAGSGWQKDPARFEEYARAVLASAQYYLKAAQPPNAAGSKRDLASVRMLLQSILKMDDAAMREHSLFGEVRKRLDEVTRREADLAAA